MNWLQPGVKYRRLPKSNRSATLEAVSRRAKTMAATSLLAAAIAGLAPRFCGELLGPSDAGYDQARRVHNGLIDKRPALVARCRAVADVVDALAMARELGLEVAVRGGGHNVAGRSTLDGGLVIDLSLMKGMRVDPRSRTAHAQGGLTWNEFNRETQLHGLATTGGVVSSTGIAGLTLGGGIGWLMGKHGLALDNLLSADIVLADGRAIRASSEEHPDLFWAVRGGGGNFGIATSLEYALHPVGPTITGGLIAWPIDQAWDVMRQFRDITSRLPDEVTMAATLVHAPDGSGARLAAIVVCHCGSLAEGEEAFRPVKAFGTPVMDTIGAMPYTEVNAMLDGGYPAGALNYWKSSFMPELSDQAIRTAMDCFAACPSPMGQLLFEHLHGAVTRVAPTDTAFAHRSPGYNMLVLGQWTDPGQSDRCIAWTRRSHAEAARFMSEHRYVNYYGHDEPPEAVAAAYGPNYRRLQQVKATYDPENLFRMNQNISPAR